MSFIKYVNKNQYDKEYSMYNINLFIKDKFINNNINVKNLIKRIKTLIPSAFFKNLDGIYIGCFSNLTERDLLGLYENSAIYLSNEIENEEEFISTFLHELSHSLEETEGGILYTDGKIEKEFLIKRRQLYNIIKDLENVNKIDFINVEYSLKFDKLLYHTIGYDKLDYYSSGIFHTPYAITSINEYFASCFEDYYSGNYADVAKISPSVVEKIQELEDIE